MTPKLLTVSWKQPENPLGGKAHFVSPAGHDAISEGVTLCGRDIPSRAQVHEVQPIILRTKAARERFDFLTVDICKWCQRKLKRGEKGMEGK